MIYLFHPHNDQTGRQSFEIGSCTADTDVVSLPPGLDWSTVELGVAIICACLPTLRPIFPKRPLMSTSLKNWYNSLRGSSKSSQGTHSRGVSRSTYGNKPAPGYNRFDTETPDTIYLTDIVGGRRAGEQNEMGRSSPRDNLSDENITQVV